MRAVVVVGKVWRELFEDFAGTLPIVRAGRTKYNSGSIFNSFKYYLGLTLCIDSYVVGFFLPLLLRQFLSCTLLTT